jgi:predicted TIM-barrel fold metal-dependent hydrolase
MGRKPWPSLSSISSENKKGSCADPYNKGCKMKVIAIEEHFMSDGIIEAIVRNSRNSGMAAYIAQYKEQITDLGSTRLRDMDAAGIDLQVISPIAPNIGSLADGEIINLTREANDQLAAAIATHPDRFAGFAVLPMVDPATSADELERTVRSLGFKGAMITGLTRDRFLDDPAFLPILERAVTLDVPIYLHPSVPPAAVRELYYSGFDPAVSASLSQAGWGWHSEVGIHALRLVLSGVFDRLPTLQIIIGHMGEMIPFMLARIDNEITPTAKHLQLSVSEYLLRNFSITTSGFFTNPPLLLALQVMGADRIIFSVDYPFASNKQGQAFLEHASISPADKEKISHLNAERLLKLAAV